MYGSKTFTSYYAELGVEAVEGGGMLITVHEYGAQGCRSVNLSADQVAELRHWMGADPSAELADDRANLERLLKALRDETDRG